MPTAAQSTAAAAAPNGAGPGTETAALTASPAAGPQAGFSVSLALALARRHWIATVLLAAGLVLRVLTQMAYHPAIIYIDSLKYLYGWWPGSDPIGYKIPLKLILAFGDLGTVTLVQHLLGLALAVIIYALLVRRGAPRWLAALAIAPLLLDAYQLQAEAMIMPDVWFEAMIVAGFAILLWKPVPALRAVAVAGAVLGFSAGVRQVGEILVVPAVVYLVILGGGWRQALTRAAALAAAFGLAVVAYMAMSLQLTGHFWLSESQASLTYGRMAAVADCATLRIPAVERPLCPTAAEQAKGPDWLEHAHESPFRRFALTAPLSLQRSRLVNNFNRSVETQQPLRLLAGISRDAVKLFGARVTSPGDTFISRWQFQPVFPTYWPYVRANKHRILLYQPRPHGRLRPEVLRTAFGGAPEVDRPIAAFLRGYQRGGGYTPGPLLAAFALAGVAGSVLALRRRPAPRQREIAQACLLFFAGAIFVLALSDFFEFTWRYQLPALVTLPPAGALGVAALVLMFRKPATPAAAGSAAPAVPELAAPAG